MCSTWAAMFELEPPLHLLMKLACVSLCSAMLKQIAGARSWAWRICVCVCVFQKSKGGGRYATVCDSCGSRQRQRGQREAVTEANLSGKCIHAYYAC